MEDCIRYSEQLANEDFGLKIGDKVKIRVPVFGTGETKKEYRGIVIGIYNWHIFIKTNKGYSTSVLKAAIGNTNSSHYIRRV